MVMGLYQNRPVQFGNDGSYDVEAYAPEHRSTQERNHIPAARPRFAGTGKRKSPPSRIRSSS